MKRPHLHQCFYSGRLLDAGCASSVHRNLQGKMRAVSTLAPYEQCLFNTTYVRAFRRRPRQLSSWGQEIGLQLSAGAASRASRKYVNLKDMSCALWLCEVYVFFRQFSLTLYAREQRSTATPPFTVAATTQMTTNTKRRKNLLFNLLRRNTTV
jgi:hypothetical protein